MNEQRTGLGEGILRGLKKIIFTEPQTSGGNNSVDMKDRDEKAVPDTNLPPVNKAGEAEVPEEIKQRVYQLLSRINKPECDFIEVWNAAVEMGGINALHIRSAYTSLRFADSTLNKSKLIDTGNAYMNELRKVLQEETEKRMEEKKRMEAGVEMNSRKLDEEISKLEAQIQEMQQKLDAKRTERETIHSRYAPEVQQIEKKITEGRNSVNLVLGEMQEVMNIIQTEIN